MSGIFKEDAVPYKVEHPTDEAASENPAEQVVADTHMEECEHEWHRASERDRIAALFGGGGYSDVVVWCSKCGTAKATRVQFPTPSLRKLKEDTT